MLGKADSQIPGNIPDGIIRNQHLDISKLSQRIVANELFECSLTGEASELYGELGPNLISCKLDSTIFPFGVSHFDAKDTVFLRSEIRHKFDRIMITQCAFREVVFRECTMKDSALVDSIFEEVTFVDCDFSVTSFKSNVFRGCSFLRCKTSNKLFEHCLFYHCSFVGLSLQEGSILQNYGIQLADTVDLFIYSAETGEKLAVEGLAPKNRLERISLEYFYGIDLNRSKDLLETVQFNLNDATRTNVLHMVTGLRQLTSFLLFLYSEEKIILYFPLQLFWSIDNFLGSYGQEDLPLNALESLEISAARLRRIYESVCLSIPPSESHFLLVRESYSEADLNTAIQELQLNVKIQSFLPFNSPSLAEITSPDTFDLILFVALVLSTSFRAEVDRYQEKRKLLDVGTRLISDGKNSPAAAYQALIALNVPKLLYIRLSAKISLSLLVRLRDMILRIVEDPRHSNVLGENEVYPPITILFLAANPQETARLRLDREIRGIDSALRSSGIRQRFRLEQIWAFGEQELQDSLLRHEPDVVHISAHGTPSGMPLLESREVLRDLGQEYRSKIEDLDTELIWGLSRVFAVAGQSVRCVFLNVCNSAKAAEAISLYVDCIIGMSSSIADEAAIRFSWSFYNSLAYGKSIKESFDLAIAQLALSGYRQSHVPRLIAGKSDPSSVFLIQQST